MRRIWNPERKARPSKASSSARPWSSTWDDEEQTYYSEFDGDDADESLLEGLLEDIDLRAFLPTEEVDVDDEWEVDTSTLGPVLLPGGALGFYSQDWDEEVTDLIETNHRDELRRGRQVDLRRRAQLHVEGHAR